MWVLCEGGGGYPHYPRPWHDRTRSSSIFSNPSQFFPLVLYPTTVCCSGVFAPRSNFLGEVLVRWFKSDHSVWSYLTHGRLWHLCQGKGGCTDYSQLFPVSFFSDHPDTWVGSWLPLTFQRECVILSSRHPPCMVAIPTGPSSFSWTVAEAPSFHPFDSQEKAMASSTGSETWDFSNVCLNFSSLLLT